MYTPKDWRSRIIRLHRSYSYALRQGSLRSRCVEIITNRMDWRRRLSVRNFIQSAHQRRIATKQARTALAALVKHKIVTLEEV